MDDSADIDDYLMQSGGDFGSGGGYIFSQSDVNMLSGNGSLPVVSDITTQMPAGSLNQTGSGGSPGGFLGSVLTEIQALPQQAKAAGTAVGQVQNLLHQSQANFNAAQQAQSMNNSLATWWLYASTTDKLLVGLTALTIVVMVMHKD